jgi:thiamine biosynthesis lipoprotein
VEFNLGGIGKGYAIDTALTKIRQEYGVRCALMQGGRSSLRVIGAPLFDPRGWMVEIGDPLREGKTVARVWLRDQALGTSGADNQFFVADGKRYGHILDPRTGWPARRVLSSSVIARTATEADALSTAFFVTGLDGAKAFCRTRPEITAILVVPGKSAPEVVVIGEADVEVFQ